MVLGKEFFLKKNQTLPSADKRALGKEFFKKKIQTLPSAGQGALGKEFLEKKQNIFAEGRIEGTRQRIFLKKK